MLDAVNILVSGFFHMAVFVLFPAAAGAWIVASDLWVEIADRFRFLVA